MVHFYQLFFNTVNVMLKLYTSLCQKAKCTLFVWSTVSVHVHKTLHAKQEGRSCPLPGNGSTLYMKSLPKGVLGGVLDNTVNTPGIS